MKALFFESKNEPVAILMKSSSVMSGDKFKTDRGSVYKVSACSSVFMKTAMSTSNFVDVFDVKMNPLGLFYVVSKNSTRFDVFDTVYVVKDNGEGKRQTGMTKSDIAEVVEHVKSSNNVFVIDDSSGIVTYSYIDTVIKKDETHEKKFIVEGHDEQIKKIYGFLTDCSISGIEKKMSKLKSIVASEVVKKEYEEKTDYQKRLMTAKIIALMPKMNVMYDGALYIEARLDAANVRAVFKRETLMLMEDGNVSSREEKTTCAIAVKADDCWKYMTGEDGKMKAEKLLDAVVSYYSL